MKVDLSCNELDELQKFIIRSVQDGVTEREGVQLPMDNANATTSKVTREKITKKDGMF